ncbi:adenosylcobinamide-phosphate synthase CbiB [Paracoccus aerius]|uniref:Cobalamin biosynthesis protein CobD n=1 Tax=Paracoccus aerius TaxID=1915382 RepID=A0ABS1S8E9_9RHOB|nr:adenosylcobinamide-phosphate synthase CbiB [Paracoccus aerius]MBL3675004.1 cobalamin biosynthesis protein CobD [Paracoccus aerius]GHG31852.1 cobalamin biosynthesis protein CobD [Paracoccus aerius]
MIADFPAMMLVALALDRLIGWPDWLYARIGHPVTWAGHLIASLDERLNRAAAPGKPMGVLVLIICIAAALLPSAVAQALLPASVPGILVSGCLAWPLVAMRSLQDHVAAVAKPLVAGELPAARHAVSMIVGRNPDALDEAGVARAALESLAENSSDGIVAPVFWGAVAGLPGIAVYKIINTLDSMIGHRNPRYLQFGWASARLDDLVNLIPARATGVLFALVCGNPLRAGQVMLRDASRHRSPNAGWPEGAMAGALGVRLSGPRIYDGHVAPEPWLNEGAPDPSPASVTQGLGLYRRAMLLLAAGLMVWSLLPIITGAS